LAGKGCRVCCFIALVGFLLLTACMAAPAPGPDAPVHPTTSDAATSPLPTRAPRPAQVSPAVPPTPTTAALDPAALRAWTLAGDGAIYVLDAAHSLHQMAPAGLAPVDRSPPLFGDAAEGEASAYLAAGQSYLFVASTAISQTLVLDRDGYVPVRRLEGAGPLALDPGRRLLMIPLGLEQAWPPGNYEVWAFDLADLGAPPAKIRVSGISLDDLAVDPARRRLYLLSSNIAASPPHRGQAYHVHDLDSLAETGASTWERGSLTRPVPNPRTGEILASRIGLNATRRFLILDPAGQEVRSRPGLDGQPVVDATGAWIYLLRERGLWLLREADLSLQSVLPFAGDPPADLALSPGGEKLYLFGNGWLTALSTAELRELGIAPVSPLPLVWFSASGAGDQVQPRLYPSPQFEADGTVFIQLLGNALNVLETYRSTDGGRTWLLLPSLVEPDLGGATYLSLSPDFATDRTLAARTGSQIFRSTDAGLSWLPWRPAIAFSSGRDGNREIYTVDLDGANLHRVTDTPSAEENPAWSPAWTRLAFQGDRAGNWDIYTMRAGCDIKGAEAAGSCDLRQLTDDPADDLLPAWSPDGRAIAFVSFRDGNPEIYVMDSSGGHQHRLTFSPSGEWRPAWRSDSVHLVFVSDRAGTNDIYEVAVPALDSGPWRSEPGLAPLIAGRADDRDPAVQAGLVERLLFLSDRDGFMRAYTTDGISRPRPAAETGQPEAHPAVLPGEYYDFLVSADRDGNLDIYRAGLSGYVPLAPSPAFDGQPAAEAPGWLPGYEAGLAWLHARAE
jgi:hypothetical protein